MSKSFAEVAAPKENSIFTPSVVEAIALCIQMIAGAVKEMISSGQNLQELDCRLLAQTCVDAFADKNHHRAATAQPQDRAAPDLMLSQSVEIH